MLPFNWMFGFGNQFPYTNFHELNMDWIIALCKDLAEKFPNMVSEVYKKLNAPEQAGQVGQFLVNLGNGKTGWEDISDAYAPVIIEAVNDWLTDHPEATTTVQDGSLTLAKMTDQVKYLINREQSPVLQPVYIGDYLTESNMLPSAVYYDGTDFITIDAKTRDYATSESNGIGNIKKYSLTENKKIYETSAVIGHGNSIAFDGTYYYIVPIWEYTNNTETRVYEIYKFNTNFVLVETISTPTAVFAVSYDEITNSLYTLGNGVIYIYENGSFVPYSTIADFSTTHDNIILDRSYNQDLAVYNNEFYISSPYGNVLHGKLTQGASFISDYYVMSHYDTFNHFYFGELEGWEFTNGHLYAIAYTTLPGNLNNAFVFEIPVNIKPQTSPVMSGIFGMTNATFTLSEATQEYFSLQSYQIRSLEQLFTMVQPNNYATQITIPADNTVIEERQIIIPNGNYILNLNGTYKCDYINIRGGTFNIFAGANTNKLIFLTNNNVSACIYLQRAGTLIISGSIPLNIEAPNLPEQSNNFINVAYYGLLSIFRTTINCTKALYIGSQRISHDEVYAGTSPIKYMPDSFVLNGFNGIISRDSKDIRLYAHLAKPVTGTYIATGTVTIRGINGYLNNASGGLNLANLNVTVSILNNYTVCIALKNNDDSAFTNCTNNTPLQAEGNITLTKTQIG